MNKLLLLAFLVLGACDKPAQSDISITGGWARETAPGQQAGAAYAVIRNGGGEDDELVAVATDRASMPMIHSSETVNGVSRMRMLQSLPVPARGSVQLRPGGVHVMMEGLKSPLTAGETVQMTFRFKKAGDIAVPIKVEAAGAR